MSDLAPPTIRSNIVTYFAGLVSTNRTVFTNGILSSIFVITFASLVNNSNSSGDGVLLVHSRTGTAFHSGFVGSGQIDRFPLTCEVAIPVTDSVATAEISGTWFVLVSGYYTPEVVAPS